MQPVAGRQARSRAGRASPAAYAAQGLAGATPEDFTFIGWFDADPAAVNIRAGAKYDSLEGLIDAVRADPGTVAASGANRRGLSHLAWVRMLGKPGSDPMAANWVASDGSDPTLQTGGRCHRRRLDLSGRGARPCRCG